jgi:hypothetical protein
LRNTAPSAQTEARELADGFSLHAAVRVEAQDRRRLERLCRYIARPALSDERIQVNAAGQVELELKRPWRDGTTHLVPQGPAARGPAAGDAQPADAAGEIRGEGQPVQARAQQHIGWARLLERVFDIDLQRCPATRSPPAERRAPSGARTMGWRSSAAAGVALGAVSGIGPEPGIEARIATCGRPQPGCVHTRVRPGCVRKGAYASCSPPAMALAAPARPCCCEGV